MLDYHDDAVRCAISDFHLSTRGAVNFTGENPWASIEEALDNPWSPKNPSGTIVMRLAENSLMHGEISDYIRQELAVERTQHLTYGHGPRGSPRLRKAVAAVFNSDFDAQKPVTCDQIIVMSGVTAVTDALIWSICNEGDGILMPQPFYTGYHIDISQRSRGVIIPVPFQGIPGYTSFDDAFDSPDVIRRAFEAQLESTRLSGGHIKAVLLTKCAFILIS
jgi:DNA-binding transcriptional MocR family regulator